MITDVRYNGRQEKNHIPVRGEVYKLTLSTNNNNYLILGNMTKMDEVNPRFNIQFKTKYVEDFLILMNLSSGKIDYERISAFTKENSHYELISNGVTVEFGVD